MLIPQWPELVALFALLAIAFLGLAAEALYLGLKLRARQKRQR